MKLFKVPKVGVNGQNKKSENNLIIGIIDASGSMTSVWPLVAEFWNKYVPASNAYTITFSCNPTICKDNVLQKDIHKHGGGSTEILKAFKTFEEKLETLPQDTEVTCLFISDGQDNSVSTLEKRFGEVLKGNPRKLYINFLCLGIQSGFPTFLSMKLRNTYHTGDPTIPAIFLIEYASEKAFFNKFESMKPYFLSSAKVNIHPPVIRFPWLEPLESVYERIWVLTDSSMVEVGEEIFDLSRDAINLEGIVEVMKGWIQELHLESLKSASKVKDMAKQTLKYMEMLFDQVKKEKGIDILKESELTKANAEVFDDHVKLTFEQLALRNMIKHSLSHAVWFYEDAKLLAEGKSPQELNEYDAAKRIGIGTIVGKYHQKALALKGITVDDFKIIRDEFVGILRETKLEPISNQEASIITLMNQKEVLKQKNLPEGLALCNSQFDLVEAFPLIGLALRIKRYNGSMINPWLTQVRFIAKHHKVVDSISILRTDNCLELKIGEDSKETINAVLPLFDKDDEDLRPLLRTRLFHLMMTFNVMLNVDTLYEDAYLSLLSNTMLFLLSNKETEWRDNLLKKIETTTRIVYYEDASFKTYRDQLVNDPVTAITKDAEQSKYGSIDLSKAMLHLYMLKVDQLADEKQIKKILEIIFARYLSQIVHNKEFDIAKIFKCKLISDSSKKAYDVVRSKFKDCKTNGDLRREVYAAFDHVVSSGAQYDYSWDLSELYKFDVKIKLDVLEEFSKTIVGKAPTKDALITIIGRSLLAGGFDGVLSEDVKKLDKDGVTGLLGKKLTVDTQKGGIKELAAVKTAVQDLLKEFSEWFKKIHWEIMPISKAKFNALCTQNGLTPAKMHHLEDSYLVKNACLAENCPFYMKYMDRVHHHMGVWNQGLPWAFHRTVRKYYKLTPEEIYDKFMHGECAQHKAEFHYTVNQYQRTEAEVMDYIKKLQKAYEEII